MAVYPLENLPLPGWVIPNLASVCWIIWVLTLPWNWPLFLVTSGGPEQEMKGSVKEPNKFHIYETEKITRKAKWRGRIYRVVRLFHPRSSCTTHLMLFSERPPIYASSCMTISSERKIEQVNIFCRVTGFTSDFLPPQTSADICVVHDDLGWKNRTTRCNRFWRAGCSWLEYVDIRLVY